MRPYGQGSATGVYHGIIKRARLQGGVLWAQVAIPAWSTPTGEYVTNWARVAIPWGTHDFGFWGSLHEGEHVLVAFEGGDPERPWVIGFIPMPQEGSDVEAPPEWVNDNYADKTPNTNAPPGRENPPKDGPEMLPGVILKSPKWKQYILLHDKLKKIVFRVAQEGDHGWEARPTEEKPEILLGELATHNVLLGDLFMELYNNHRHRDVWPGSGVSGPPVDSDKIDPEIHLSHVVYVVRDPTDQAPTSSAFRLPELGKKLFSAAGGGGGGGGGGLGDVLKAMQDFCQDPGGFVADIAKNAGVPGPIVDAAKGIIGNFIGNFLDNAVKLVKDATGIPIPTPKDVCELADKLGKGDLVGVAQDVVKKAVVMGLAAVGVPPGVTEGALNLAEGLLNQGQNLNQVAGAVAGQYGAQGLAAMAGAMTAAFGG